MTRSRSSQSSAILAGLNEVQREATASQEGPVLVLAGAGSGKTKVLTHRIAYLIAKYKVPPSRILAVTFTNKAANEMKTRLRQLLHTDSRHLWVGTFHAIFSRILRSESAYIGYGRNFVIYDTSDQLQVVKNIMSDHHLSTKDFPPKMIRAMISRMKNEMTTPDMLRERVSDRLDEAVHTVYVHYQGFLKTNNAMDFDDLITIPVKLFREHPKILRKYQERFQHILVDEFQDTNVAQNELVIQLSSAHRHVFLVGDDDQSIYRWRGAEIKNIFNFEHAFPECQVFRLEQNYRSTKNILDAAYSVVKNNLYRKEKRLWTNQDKGEPLVLIDAYDSKDEASKIVNRIRYEISHNKKNFNDFVVLYRTNAQSRAIEDVLRRNAISYVIVGGLKFYERKEIKDFLAYLRVINNTKDSVSLQRILNVPQRGIGKVTQTKLMDFANKHQIYLLDALLRVDEIDNISNNLKERIKSFGELFIKYRSLLNTLGFDELARVLNDEIGFLRLYKEENTIESMNRYDNIQELLSAISEFCQTREEPTLEGFLEEVSLVTDIDTWNDQSNAVTLMTLHSAKGLEFPVVFIAGLSEGLFPLSRNKEDPKDLEEERRLFYVGLTRAKEKVYLSWAENSQRFRDGFTNELSSFVEEINPEFLERLVPLSESATHTSEIEPEYEALMDYEEESQEIPIYVGCHVSHEMFGEGIVTRIEGEGDNLKVSVNFQQVGEKKLLYRYAQLQIL